MTITVKDSADLIVPASVRKQAGIKAGDRVEFKVSGGVINIFHAVPLRVAPPRVAAPEDNEEYSPDQRRVIDARLALSAAELDNDQGLGPFDSADEMIAHMKRQLRKRRA